MRSLGRTLTIAAACLAAISAAPAAADALEPPPPLGANVPCKPTAAHPDPVVLVHGTFANRTNSFQALAPALKANGYCVYALDYGAYAGSAALGVYGTGPIAPSAEQLRDYVNQVLAATGARKVDIVGHSQGGMLPRYYIKDLGGAAKVDDLVGLSPSNHGTSNPFAVPAGLLCPACAQQATGSAFLTALNAGDETPGAVRYRVIATRYDEVVLPYTSGFLDGATNITLQDRYPADVSEHLAILYSPSAIKLVLAGLD